MICYLPFSTRLFLVGLDFDCSVTRMSLLNLGQLYVRYIALFADPALGGPKAMV